MRTCARTSRLLNVVMYGCVHVCTAMSCPAWKAFWNSLGFCTMLTPIMKCVVLALFASRKSTSFEVGYRIRRKKERKKKKSAQYIKVVKTIGKNENKHVQVTAHHQTN